MKYYLDTEFIEGPKQRKVFGFKVGRPVPTIDLISIGIVAEDGRKLYLLNADCELGYAWQNEWVRNNVLRPIYCETYSGDQRLHYDFALGTMRRLFKRKGLKTADLRTAIAEFVGFHAFMRCPGIPASTVYRHYLKPEQLPSFYGYYSDYDWVVFCQLFGRMIDLPEGFPMYCLDLKQEMKRLNAPDSIKPENGNEHNALADAKWNKLLHERLIAQYPNVA